MAETPRGAGVLFYDRERSACSSIARTARRHPFRVLDILGGHTEPGETAEGDRRSGDRGRVGGPAGGGPFILTGHRLFTVYTDARGVTDSSSARKQTFTLTDVRLKEGQELVWVTEAEARATPLAFGYKPS